MGGEASDFLEAFNYLPIMLFGGALYDWRIADADIILPNEGELHGPGSDGADWVNDRSFAPTFNGTVRYVSVRVSVNERINDCTVYLRDALAITECLVLIGPQETGYFAGTTSYDFEIGSTLDGAVYSPMQDHEDPDYVGNELQITGGWDELESTTDAEDQPVHFGITTLGRPAGGARNDHVDELPEPDWSPCFGCGPAGNNELVFSFSDAEGELPARQQFFLNIGGQGPGPALDWVNGFESVPLVEQEAVCQRMIRVPGAYTALTAYISYIGLEGDDDAVTIMFRVNGSDTNLFIFIEAHTTGNVSFFPDAGDPPAVVDGDRVAYSVTTSSISGGMGLQWLTAQFLSDDDRSDLCATWPTLDLNHAGYYSTTFCPEYSTISGGLYYHPLIAGTDSTWEDDTDPEAVYLTCPSEYEFSALRLDCQFFDGDPFTYSTFIDGAAGNLTVIVDGTGLFEDLTHTDDVSLCAGGKICYQLAVDTGTSCFARLNHVTIAHRGIDPIPCGDCICTHECDNALTLCELYERTARMLGEDPEAPVYWTAAEVKRHINDAYIEAARETKALELIEGIELSAESEAGTLSAQVGQIFRATFDDYKIENVTKWELDRTETNWEALTGFVSSYVTTLDENRAITTFKAWDGSAINAQELFFDDAYTYTGWGITTPYVTGDRVTYTNPTDGITRGYVCIADHTSGTSSWPGLGATWETYWVPIALMVWAVKNPVTLEDCDEPELPPWSHLGLAFRAAARCLRKRGEMRNEPLADAYDAIALDYFTLLKGHVASRTPERLIAMGRTATLRRPPAWQQPVETS
jgi:hypothetical protein